MNCPVCGKPRDPRTFSCPSCGKPRDPRTLSCPVCWRETPTETRGQDPWPALVKRFKFSRFVITLAYLALLSWLVANYLGG